MTRTISVLIVGAVLWAVWCVLVLTQIVPYLRRHITIYSWAMAYLLCLAPVVLSAAVLLVSTRRKE